MIKPRVSYFWKTRYYCCDEWDGWTATYCDKPIRYTIDRICALAKEIAEERDEDCEIIVVGDLITISFGEISNYFGIEMWQLQAIKAV